MPVQPVNMRPFLSYYGAKWTNALRYPAPRHVTVIEPFAGSAGYSVRHFHRNVVLIDADEKIVTAWRFLIGANEADIMSLPVLPPGVSLDEYPDLPEGARQVISYWLLPASSSGGRQLSSWGKSRYGGASYWGPKRRRILSQQVKWIRHWTVIHGDYRMAGERKATWFIDPPYQNLGKHYRHSEIDYEELGSWCRDRRGQVIVCEHLGADWLPFKPMYRKISTAGYTETREHTEAIWYRPK